MAPRIRLLRIDHALADALRSGDEEFLRAFGATVAEARPFAEEIVASSLGFFVRQGEPWGGFLAVDDATAQVVGTGAFKGAPSEDGDIEIAYYTFPPFERRGYATALARELYDLAASSSLVRLVLAHTLPEPNASTRVLGRLGMRFAGEVWDPEDGKIWRWERPTAETEPAGSRPPD